MNRLPTGVVLNPTHFNVVAPSLSQIIGTGVVVPSGADSGKVIVTLVNGRVSLPMKNGPKLREWCFENFVVPVLNGEVKS